MRWKAERFLQAFVNITSNGIHVGFFFFFFFGESIHVDLVALQALKSWNKKLNQEAVKVIN